MDHQLTQEEYLLIEAYLLGDLEAEALASFVLRLQNEAWLQAEVQAFQELYEGIKYFHAQETLTNLTTKLEAEGFFLDELSIEQYYLGELSPELIPIFEKKRAEDPQFAKQIEEFEAMIKGLQGFQEENELRSSLANVEASLEKEKFFETNETGPGATDLPPVVNQQPRSILKVIYRMGIAASFVLLAGLGLRLLVGPPLLGIVDFTKKNSLPEVKLFAEVKKTLAEKSGPEEEDMVYQAVALDDALQYYDLRLFDTAYQHLKRYVSGFPKDNNGQFYFGVTSLELGDYQSAEKAFQFLMQQPKSKFFESAKWYLAVAELKTNPEQGKKRIKAIATDSASPYQTTAQRTVRKYRLK